MATRSFSPRHETARIRAARNAVAHQRLEGLTVDAATARALDQAARGELDVGEVLAGIRARIARAEI